jgi:hypothetical protein
MDQADENDQLAGWLRRIKAAGGKVSRARRRLRQAFWAAAGLFFLCLIMVFAWEWYRVGPPWQYLEIAAWLGTVAAFLLVLCFPFLFPAPALYRRLLRRRLSRQLHSLPREQLVEVLRPLRNEGGDTGKLVEPFLRELLHPTELTPAGAPSGRGDEPTPAA